MKLLGIGMSGHDHSVSYFDGHELRFHKFERTKEIKRYRIDNPKDLESEIQKIWDVSIRDMDDIAFTCHFPLSRYLSITLPGVSIPHHYAHALSVYPIIGKKPDISFVIDGEGDNKTWSVFKDNICINFGSKQVEGSIGHSMRKLGLFMGVKVSSASDQHNIALMLNDIAGKSMGLQSYGEIDNEYLNYLQKYDISDINGLFDFSNWESFKKDHLVAELTKLNWMKTVFYRVEELLLNFFKKFATPDDVIGYSGGVAQNVVWNTTLKKHFKNLYIAPHSSDEGLSLGCLEWLRQKHNLPLFHMHKFPYIQSDVSPPDYPSDDTIKLAAQKLAEGKTVAWYQGNGEVGPRALGNRSILLDPRIPDGKAIVNRIKNRENYRPFGASILKEYAQDYFDISWEDEYMLYTCRVKNNDMPSITHIDGTCRIQTVGNKNIYYRKLLEEFNRLTGCPLLLNTSLNIAGCPIAGYPDVVEKLLKSTSLDYGVVGNTFYMRDTK